MKTDPNAPAFPSPASPGNQDNLGLTKREEFIKAAMQGFCADPKCESSAEDIAHGAVVMADALIAELNKTP
jgi:hypothetical protein